MNRRALPAIVLAAVVLAVAAAWSLLRPGRDSGSAPEAAGPVVFISIDTLRADRLPAYGYTRTKTPHIDRFAADGIVFENAYAHSPQTLPSHTSILSGELPFEHGVRDNIGFTVKEGQRFLQHALKEAGYATAGFVSSYVLRRQTNFHQGFDTFDDELPPVSPEQPLGNVQRRGEDTIAAAIRWIDEAERRAQGRKLFLFAHIYEPHTPYAPPARFTNPDPYDGEVEYSDEIVGRLLEHLRQKGLYEDALIVLLSDHGEGLGDHGEEEHGIFLYRETIRVPLIVKMPGGAGAGRRLSAPVQHVDLPPTVLEAILGGRRGAGGQGHGRSLLPAITGSGELAPANIYSESLSPRYHFGWSELYALSDERYRLIRAPRDELYDLAQDPGELRSIAGERPQVRTAMRGALDAMLAGARVAAPSAVSEEDRQKLAALGYVGTQTATSLQLPGDQLPDPKDKLHVLAMYREASRLAGEGRHADAIRLYRDLLREEPAMTDVWLQLAGAHTAMRRPHDALAAYKEVISRDPRNAAALTGAAAALLQIGRVDEAKAHADLAVEVAPAIAHEMLARIAVRQGNPAAARSHADLAQQADPSLPMRAFIDGMLLHQQGQFAAAAQRLLEAQQAMAARTEQLADLHYLAADSLARLERYAEAERLFKTEIALFPSHVRAHAGLAMLYKVTGRDAEAERAVQRILEIAPDSEGIDTAAQLWTMFGEPGKAAAVRRRSPR
ncbi:MAG TPA: sulfatase-like hydrolase/transferase [Vicinamibacterales bacterium]|nr:sulfatase-like hydrolase/transferase [Vicinamibacterales bacterium]